MSELPHFRTMAEFYAAIGGSLRQDLECTVNRLEDLHGEVPYRSPLFRADYYSVVLVTYGRTTYIIDDTSHRTSPGTVYFTNPGHVKGFEILEPARGFVITFSEAFLKETLRADVFDEFPFLIAEVVPPRELDDDAAASLTEVAEQMRREADGDSTYRGQVLASLLIVLLLRIKEAAWDDYDPRAEADGATAIVRDFRRNLEAHFRSGAATQLQVQDLARAQSLHPTYLGSVVRKKTGRTVQAWIAEKTTAEAKALLARTDLSIKEVAHRLGFGDPGHFSRHFRRHAGQSPSAFRSDARN